MTAIQEAPATAAKTQTTEQTAPAAPRQPAATVIYHRADFDGLFCREIARKFLPTDTWFIGWDFGDEPLEAPTKRQLYVLDLPVDRVFGFNYQKLATDSAARALGAIAARTIWIDHHKSSIESHPANIPGYRIDGVAACRLAWQWFKAASWAEDGILRVPQPQILPNKLHFIERSVSEPWAVRLAGEYDVWDKRDPDAELFQHGLRSQDLLPFWPALLNPGTHEESQTVKLLAHTGRYVQYAEQRRQEGIISHLGFLAEFEGLKCLALNTAGKGSHQFAALDIPETGHEALLKFNWDGERWDVSLYHAKHRTDVDLSKIAAKHGGGGHKGAAGFRCATLPFLPAGEAKATLQTSEAPAAAPASEPESSAGAKEGQP